MDLQFHPYSLALAFSALISAATGVTALLKRPAPGAAPLAVLMLGAATWSCAYAISWLNATEQGQLFWLNATYFGVLIIPAGFLIFTLHVTGRQHWLTSGRLALLAIEPLITLLIVWTNDSHHWFRSSYAFVLADGLGSLHFTRGPWFVVNVLYSHTLILIGFSLLARALARSAPLFRAQIGAMLLGASLPWAANVYSLAESGPLHDLDITPVTFSLTGVIFAYALFRQRLFDLLPVARSVIIERMSDGVLVVDDRLRILDVNPAARKLLQLGDEVLGRDGLEVFPEWKDLAAAVQRSRAEFRTEVQGRPDSSRRFDLTINPLLDQRENLSGHLIVFRETTQRWQAEQELRRANEELKDRLKEINVLQKRLRVQVARDPLTNLYNRRHLMEGLERELQRAARDKTVVSIILIDIDDFKQINDTYGHKAGDAALRFLADLFRVHIRGSDIACRYGGEEFVLVMPGTPPEVARKRVEHLRQEFQAADLYGKGTAGQTTLSIGVAAFPAHGRRAEEVLHAADKTMYRAKAQGGGRTLLHGRLRRAAQATGKTGGSNSNSKPGRKSPRRSKAARSRR
jgi:diguanylate cyclase (GGDEF)-like protein/PAS domain S-box-containing protein